MPGTFVAMKSKYASNDTLFCIFRFESARWLENVKIFYVGLRIRGYNHRIYADTFYCRPRTCRHKFRLWRPGERPRHGFRFGLKLNSSFNISIIWKMWFLLLTTTYTAKTGHTIRVVNCMQLHMGGTGYLNSNLFMNWHTIMSQST